MQPRVTHKKVWNKTWGNLGKPRLDQTSKIIFSQMAQKIDFKNQTVLELGSGMGRLSYQAALAGAKKVTLVDFSHNALKISKELFKNFKGRTKVDFIQKNILKFKSQKKYDIVFSSGLIEHFRQPYFDRLVALHLELAKKKTIIIVPAALSFNRWRFRSVENKNMYGWQRPLTKREIFESIKKSQISYRNITHQRFYLLYQFGFRRKLAQKKRLYKIICQIFNPLDHLLGGLSMTIVIF